MENEKLLERLMDKVDGLEKAMNSMNERLIRVEAKMNLIVIIGGALTVMSAVGTFVVTLLK